MDLPVLPPRPVGSFGTFASTIASSTNNILPVQSTETAARRPVNSTQHAINGRFQVFGIEVSIAF